MTITEGTGIFGATTNDPVPFPKGHLSAGAGALTITLASEFDILTNISPETIIINPTEAISQLLPTLNVKAGKSFYFIINADAVNTVQIMSASAEIIGDIATEPMNMVITALVDAPFFPADWHKELVAASGGGLLFTDVPVVLTNKSPDTILVIPAATMLQDLPTTGVKAGKIFNFIIYATDTERVSVLSSGGDPLIDECNLYANITLTALIDNPVLGTDWHREIDMALIIYPYSVGMRGTHNGPTRVEGNFTVFGNFIHNGDLTITGNLVNNGGFNITINGNLKVEGGLLATNAPVSVGDMLVKGNCSIGSGVASAVTTYSADNIQSNGMMDGVIPDPTNPSLVGAFITITSGVNAGSTGTVYQAYPWGQIGITPTTSFIDDFSPITFSATISVPFSVKYQPTTTSTLFKVEGDLICGDFDGSGSFDGANPAPGLNVEIWGDIFPITDTIADSLVPVIKLSGANSTDVCSGGNSGNLFVKGTVHTRTITLNGGHSKCSTGVGGNAGGLKVGAILGTVQQSGYNTLNDLNLIAGDNIDDLGNGGYGGGSCNRAYIAGDFIANNCNMEGGSTGSNGVGAGGNTSYFEVGGNTVLQGTLKFKGGDQYSGADAGRIYSCFFNGKFQVNTLRVRCGAANAYGGTSPSYVTGACETFMFFDDASFMAQGSSGLIFEHAGDNYDYVYWTATPDRGVFIFYKDVHCYDRLYFAATQMDYGLTRAAQKLPVVEIRGDLHTNGLALSAGHGRNTVSGNFELTVFGHAHLGEGTGGTASITLVSNNLYDAGSANDANRNFFKFMGGVTALNMNFPTTGSVDLMVNGQVSVNQVNMNNATFALIRPSTAQSSPIMKIGSFTGTKTSVNNFTGTPQTLGVNGLLTYDVMTSLWLLLSAGLPVHEHRDTASGGRVIGSLQRLYKTSALSIKAISNWVSQTGTITGGCNGICWSPELGIFCAITGFDVNGCMTSHNGINWSSATVVANNWKAICWSPTLGLFCAVSTSGSNNRVMTSPNGIVWTTQNTTGKDYSWTGICWSPELSIFCAVSTSGTSNQMMTSPDGVNWTLQSVAGSTLGYSKICWSSELGLFLALSQTVTNSIAISSNGSSWTVVNSGVSLLIADCCWSPELGLFCIVGMGGGANYVLTSPNGTTWTSRPAQGTPLFNVAWSAELNLFIASGSNASSGYQTSPDGITWTARTFPISGSWAGMCWSPQNGIFAIINAGATTTVLTSLYVGKDNNVALSVANTLEATVNITFTIGALNSVIPCIFTKVGNIVTMTMTEYISLNSPVTGTITAPAGSIPAIFTPNNYFTLPIQARDTGRTPDNSVGTFNMAPNGSIIINPNANGGAFAIGFVGTMYRTFLTWRVNT